MLLWEDGVARKLDTRNEPGHEPGDHEPGDAPADAAGGNADGESRDPTILAAAQAGDR